ncbi:MAG: hypothetical protein ACT4P5_21645 [Armatimonadota bacterium]
MTKLRPISVRLEPNVDRPVRDIARRTRRPVGRVVNDLIDRSLRAQRFPGVVFVDGPAGTRAHLAGTGLDVWEVTWLVRDYGSLKRFLKAFPDLPRPVAETALAYSAEYPDEIAELIAENERPVEDVLRDFPHIRVVRR